MKPIFTRPATPEDIFSVAPRLRAADHDEVFAAGGMPPLPTLLHQYQAGADMHAAGIVELDRPEVLYGCDPVYGYPQVGVIWMLGTDTIFDHPVEFTITSRRIFNEFHERFEVLTNYVDARNERHIKWLKWLGCRFLRRVDHYGPFSFPFLEFASVRLCA